MSAEAHGRSVTSGSTVFVALKANGSACPVSGANTLTVLTVTDNPKPATGTAWCAAINARGAPIATTSDGSSDFMIWMTGAAGDNMLHGFRGDTGDVLFAGGTAADLMTTLRPRNTILAAEGRLFVAGKNVLYAFSPDPNQQ